MNNKLTIAYADAYTWYDVLPWWKKVIATVFNLRTLFYIAFLQGWEACEEVYIDTLKDKSKKRKNK